MRRDAHVELAGRRKLHSQRNLLATGGHHGLVDGHVRESDREFRDWRLGGLRHRLPRGHHVARGRHQHAPVHVVVHQELVLPTCNRAWGEGSA